MKKLLLTLFLALCAQTLACKDPPPPPPDPNYVDVGLLITMYGCVLDGNDIAEGAKLTVKVDVTDVGEVIDTKEFSFVRGKTKAANVWPIQVPDNYAFDVSFVATSKACQACSDCVFVCSGNSVATNQGKTSFNIEIKKDDELFLPGDVFTDDSCTCQTGGSCRIGSDGTGGSANGSGGASSGGASSTGGNSGLGGQGGAMGTGGDVGSGGTGGSIGTENLALKATVAAETTFSGYSADRTIDGDRSTELGGASSWSNAWNHYDLPQYVTYTLAATSNVSKVDVYTTASLPIKDFDIVYHDGSNWVVLREVRGNVDAFVSTTFAAVSTNKIAIFARKGPDSQFNFARLNEVEIY